jgi:hypothetical protein
LSVVSVGRLLRKLGMSPQRPLHRAYSRAPRRSAGGNARSIPPSRRRPKPPARPSTSLMRPGSARTTTQAPPGRPWARPRR